MCQLSALLMCQARSTWNKLIFKSDSAAAARLTWTMDVCICLKPQSLSKLSGCFACMLSPIIGADFVCLSLLSYDWQPQWLLCRLASALWWSGTDQCVHVGLVQSDFSAESSRARTCSRLRRWLVGQMPDVRNLHRRHILWRARNSGRSSRRDWWWRGDVACWWSSDLRPRCHTLLGAAAAGIRQATVMFHSSSYYLVQTP